MPKPKIISNITPLISLLKIGLATEIEADLVFIDETLDRRFAKHANLKE